MVYIYVVSLSKQINDMTTIDKLVAAAKAPKRNASVIAQLFTQCQMEGEVLNARDYLDPNKAIDLRYSTDKDHRSSAA